MADDWDLLKADLADAIDEVIEKHGHAINDLTIEYPEDDEIEIWIDLVIDDDDDDEGDE